MATVPSSTRFIGVSSSVNLAEKRSAQINSETESYSMQDISDSVALKTVNGDSLKGDGDVSLIPGFTGATYAVNSIQVLTSSEYSEITTPDTTTVYFIV